MTFSVFTEQISQGTIIQDSDYRFINNPDVITPKWLLFLTDTSLDEYGNSYVVCLTTSKMNTYKKSFLDIHIIEDSSAPENAFVVECERIELISKEILAKKFKQGSLAIKKNVSEQDLKKFFDIIERSERIEEYKKTDWLNLY